MGLRTAIRPGCGTTGTALITTSVAESGGALRYWRRGVDTYLETVYYVRQEARQVALRFAAPIGLVSPTGRWAGRFERCHAAENGQRGSDQLSTGYRRGPGEPDQ